MKRRKVRHNKMRENWWEGQNAREQMGRTEKGRSEGERRGEN